MAIKEVTQHWILTCDCCAKETKQTGTHRPSSWVGIKIGADAVDYQGHAAADASRDILLCKSCGPVVLKAINGATKSLLVAALSTPTEEPKT